MRDIQVEPYVESINMPENVKIGLMVSEYRKRCENELCTFDYYGFAFGQSPFHVPPPILKALADNADKGEYSDAQGIPQLREAVSGFNKRHFGLDIDPSRIFIGPGTKELIHFVFYILRGGVIIPSPSWIGYYPLIKLDQKHYHTYYLKPEHEYKIYPPDLDKFLSELHGGQHTIVINNPHNPTGTLYFASELEEIAEICLRHNTFVLSDEIYALTTYDFDKFCSMGKIYPEGTFITNGLAKDRSCGGYRMGHLILPEGSPKRLLEDFKVVAATVYTNVSTPTQHAAVVAYEENEEIEEYFKITRNIHRMMGTYIKEGFDSIDGIRTTKPYGGFYFFADFNKLKPRLKKKGVSSSNDLAHALIDHPYHIAVVSGDSVMLDSENFGARIAFVDYKGKKAFENYKNNPPKTENDEVEFVKQNAPRMVEGTEALRRFVSEL